MEENVKPSTMPSQSQALSQPSRFLTLPRELRQKILLLSLNEAYMYDLEFNILLRHLDRCLNGLPRSPLFAPNIMKTALAIRMVNTSIREDLPYVIEKCLVRFEGSMVRLEGSMAVRDMLMRGGSG
ncbi:hypothetical protein E2P81_ATG06502 [Venturia nashicola]|uniref:Uncharacterized protein n=1 Tax=Venturia nashicola TaxID=86259 RepID=A0A4Z1PDE4_9PEZI|nr:hypothetical protein E6O75_ATG06669 [Venturia nashicola]TLD29849.1 hypothetical protein E2P81_ATG06502 [Venturia nashicola]